MKLKFFLNFFITLLLLGAFLLPVHADLAEYQENCSVNSTSEACQPPQLSDIQTLTVNLLGTVWALGGVIFMGLLIYNGMIYLLGSWEEAKYILGASLEDVQKRMVQWGISFMIFLFSYPFMNSVLKFAVADSECYESLQSPVVMFVFPDVCNYVPQPSVEPTGGVTEAPTSGVVMTCAEFKTKSGIDPTTICSKNCPANVASGTIMEFAMDNNVYGLRGIKCACHIVGQQCISFKN